MVTTKREDVTMQSFCKILKKTPSSGKSLISTYSIFFCVGGGTGVGVGAYFSLSGKGRVVRCGWALIRGWVFINFFCL